MCIRDSDITILQSYAGTWIDPLKGKELTLAQYEQGADIVMNVASGTGTGVLAVSYTHLLPAGRQVYPGNIQGIWPGQGWTGKRRKPYNIPGQEDMGRI